MLQVRIASAQRVDGAEGAQDVLIGALFGERLHKSETTLLPPPSGRDVFLSVPGVKTPHPNFEDEDDNENEDDAIGLSIDFPQLPIPVTSLQFTVR